jgi:hypothetical protein
VIVMEANGPVGRRSGFAGCGLVDNAAQGRGVDAEAPGNHSDILFGRALWCGRAGPAAEAPVRQVRHGDAQLGG